MSKVGADMDFIMDPLDESLEDEIEEEVSEGIDKLNSFFMVWESNCRNFIDEQLRFSCNEAMESLKVYVFMRKDTPQNALPPLREWVEQHITLTTCPYASDMFIAAWLVQQCTELSSHDIDMVFYLVSERERKYEELIAILQANNPQLQIKEINGSDKTIFDVIDNTCRWCKMVFLNSSETENHFNSQHNYLCTNSECTVERFPSEKELQKHLDNQKRCHLCSDEVVFCREKKLLAHLKETHNYEENSENTERYSNTALVCQFCPQKNFSCIEQKEIHMKNCHKKCNCSCGQYFRNRDEYLQHFYIIYPLACFENRKCPHRFQSALYQAIHHKQEHFALQPFYCVPCHQRSTEDGSTRKVCFKDENSLRIHGASLGHDQSEMFLPEQRQSYDMTKLAQRRVPSRTCSAINYC